ncbi:Oidioi.mRNA.OKI2018_I69.XSR.g16227.t1.cds [Oikopleura dioica]|uniref:Oidioi.mRNA.OKI2018_I69.XSR.g16227.t1.cds n=1 Tax=Oikopleura dioica TaxID=34765 RepID=A0ABN7SLR6_OIKDI|nr:Oidioi.mRNA.OKI2018_I69.XSR.g16227.t1.cds [Oikopleura dioica]
MVDGEFFDISMRRHGFLLIVTLVILYLTIRSSRESQYKRNESDVQWKRKQYDAQLLIYNRVQKCGSRSLLQAIRPTLDDNGVQFGAENLVYWLTKEAEAEVVSKIQNFSQKNTRSLWAQHIHFLHFIEKPIPLYINLVREPVERFISHFYFRRFLDNGKKKANMVNGMINEGSYRQFNQTVNDCVLANSKECTALKIWKSGMVPYFCGDMPICEEPSEEALKIAKNNIDRSYLVIGLTENFNDFVEVLESMLPKFFDGLKIHNSIIYEYARGKTETKNKEAQQPATENTLKFYEVE